MSSRRVVVEEASPSPPPLPKEPLPEGSTSARNATATGSTAANEGSVDGDGAGEGPNDGSGGDAEDQSEGVKGNEAGKEEEEEEWDPAEERLPGQTSAKGKGKAVEGETSDQPWQAVWAAEQNAWYFWNSITGEVTWTNPLEPAPPLPNEPVPPPLPQEAPPLPEGHFGQVPDIDPDLAYLLPATQRGGAGAGAGASGGHTAAFNARTGRFQPSDSQSIDHLEEWNRAKRQAGKYFDVEQWEQSVREENAKRKREAEEGGGGDKKLSKKDLERFKKKKAEQKMRKQAWLRD